MLAAMDVELRTGTVTDTEAVAAVFGAARAGLGFLPRLHTEDEDRSFFRGQLARLQSSVALRNGAVVGFAIFGEGWLHHLYVDPTAQGEGIGARLLARVRDGLGDAVQLWTFEANAGARRFYERHGFEPVERTDGSGNEERLPDVRYTWRA